MELNKINIRTVPVTIAGETLNVKRKAVTFDDWRIIAERQKAYREAEEKDTQPDTYPLIQNLAQIVIDLDLTNDGKPLPVTTETLKQLDVALLVAIHDAVMEDANPNPTQP